MSSNEQLSDKVHQLKAEASKTPIDYEKKARLRRKKRAIQLVVKLTLFVFLPTIMASIYYLHFARDQYMSSSGISVQKEGKATLGVDSILGSFASGSSNEAITVQEYILCRDMLRLLNEKIDFINHYKDPRIDYLARLPKDASFEDAFEYYKEMVSAVYDSESGVLRLEVKAFDAKSAHYFAETIIGFAEDKVNSMSKKMQQDKINFTKKVVKEAEGRLASAQKNILEIQKKLGDFSPKHSVTHAMGLKTQLENAKVMTQMELRQARAIMSPSAPKVQELQRRVSLLQAQIDKEKTRLLGTATSKDGLGQDMIDFEMAMLEKELSEKEYQSALISLETARLDAMRQTSYLVEISSPSLPDEATFPKRWLKIITVFLVSLAVFGIFSLVISAVKEHAQI